MLTIPSNSNSQWFFNKKNAFNFLSHLVNNEGENDKQVRPNACLMPATAVESRMGEQK